MSVGMPYSLLLDEFGNHVWQAFGHMSYHVGSSLREKQGWRDVDVRLIIPDDEYAAMGFGDPERTHTNRKWVSTILAWSSFGKSLTGLPIDFQIQQQTYANSEKNNGPRSALFLAYDVDECAVIIAKHSPLKDGVAYMQVPRCDSCRWWLKTNPDYGLCKMSSIDETIAGLPPVEQRLISSRDLRAVSTYQSFGCVQWEARR